MCLNCWLTLQVQCMIQTRSSFKCRTVSWFWFSLGYFGSTGMGETWSRLHSFGAGFSIILSNVWPMCFSMLLINVLLYPLKFVFLEIKVSKMKRIRKYIYIFSVDHIFYLQLYCSGHVFLFNKIETICFIIFWVLKQFKK